MDLPILQRNSCDECSACCTVLGVAELKKPDYVPCEHLCDKGCSIYEQRPPSCKGYECFWLANSVAAELRPDRIGVVIEMKDFPFGGGLTMREVWQGAFDESKELFHDLASQLKRMIYLIRPDNTRMAYFPKGTEFMAVAFKMQAKGWEDAQSKIDHPVKDWDDKARLRQKKKLARLAKKRSRR